MATSGVAITPDASQLFTARTLVFIGAALAMLGNYYVYDSIGPVAEQLSRELGFSDLQIGTLNAIYSLPNIFLVLMGGILVDRFGSRVVALVTSIICLLGAVLTTLGSQFPVMAAGRLLFGIGGETLLVSLIAAISLWFEGRNLALFLALAVSLARLGSYIADRSPTFAHGLYERGWQPPLWLAVGFAGISVLGASIYAFAGRRVASAAPEQGVFNWRKALRFRREYWYLAGLCVTFYAVIFPFRSTFAIKYFQQAHGLALEEASRLNSTVFMAAIFATPVFGFLCDRVGRHALFLIAGSLLLPASFVLFGRGDIELWLPTALLGISFSLVPAVLWPAVAHYVIADQRGTAYGLMTMLQAAGLVVANAIVGYLNDQNGASATHAQGYAPMLWFFGLVSLAGFFFAALLARSRREQRA